MNIQSWIDIYIIIIIIIIIYIFRDNDSILLYNKSSSHTPVFVVKNLWMKPRQK